MQRATRRVGAVLVGAGLLASGLVAGGPADASRAEPAGPAPVAPAVLARPTVHEALRAGVPVRVQPGSGVGISPQWPTEEPCFADPLVDPAGEPTADLVSGTLNYLCDDDEWRATARLSGPPSAAFAELDWQFDTDMDSTTGCKGVDQVLAVARVEGRWQVFRVRATSCRSTDVRVTRLDVGSPWLDARTVRVPVAARVLGLPRQFFYVVTTFTDAGFIDAMPNRVFSWVVAWRTPFEPAEATLADTPDHAVVTDTDGDGIADFVGIGNGADPDAIRLRRGRPLQFVPGPALDVPGTYAQALAGDFDGDGVGDVFLWGRGADADLLLRGDDADGSLDPLAVSPSDAPSVGGSADAQLVAGDFDGDGATDLVLYEPGPTADTAFAGGGATPLRTTVTLDFVRTFALVVPGDFNDDGKDDLLLYGAGADADKMKLGRAAFAFADGRAIAFTTEYDRGAAGDVNGDGNADLLLRRASRPAGTSPWDLWYGLGRGTHYRPRGIEPPRGARPLVGPLSRTGGTADLLWFRPGTASDAVWYGLRV